VYVNDGPISDFNGTPLDGDAPVNVQFQDASLGTVTGYLWDFGDGQTSTEQNPIHAFLASDDYDVRLRVEGSNPDEIVKTAYVHVREPAPVADFTIGLATGTYPLTVGFTDLSTGVVNSYLWEFGDGETSTEQNPTHVYQSDGDYTVRLTAYGPDYSDITEKVDAIHIGDRKWWATGYRYPLVADIHEEAS